MAGEFEEHVTIDVTGADSLARAGKDAEEAARGVDKLKHELAELGASSAGGDAAAASIGHIRDESLEAAAALEAMKRSAAGAGSAAGGGGLGRDLRLADDAARDLRGRFGGGGGGRGGLVRDFEDLERGAADAGSEVGDLSGVMDGLTKAGGYAQAIGMPALIVGIASAASTIGPALLAAGAGFGAWGVLAAPAILKVKNGLTDVTAAQQAYQKAAETQKLDPTKAHAASAASALLQLKAVYASMPPDIRSSVKAVQGLESAFSKAAKPIQKDALKDIPGAIKDIKGLIPALSGLANAANPLVGGAIKDLGKFEKSSGFTSFLKTIDSEVPGAARALKPLAGALGSIATSLFSKGNVKIGEGLLKSVGGFAKEFGPGTVKSLGSVAKDMTEIMNVTTKAANSPIGHAIGDVFSGLGKAAGFAFKGLPKFGASTWEKILGSNGMGGAKGATFKFKVQADTSGAKAQLDALTKKPPDEKIKISVDGTAARTSFQGVVSAAKTAGTQAGSGLAAGISSGSGKASAAAAAVAGGVKSGVAPLPGALHATGAAAGAGMAAGISGETGAVSAAAAGLAAAAESAAKIHLQISSPSKKFKKIGEQTVEGYIEGLLGGKTEIDAAIKALTGSAPFKDAGITNTVKALRKEIDTAFTDKKITGSKKLALTQLLDDDNTRLMNLAQKRQKLINQIQAAEALAKSVQQAALQGADLGTIAGSTIQGQQDAAAASGSGNISGAPTGPASVQAGLQAQLKSIQTFNSQIKQLKRDGLDKEGIRDLLNDGVQAGGEAATQILAGGKKGVQAIAQLDNSIGLASKKLGITGGNAAYEGASQIGTQLAAGLKDSLKAVSKEMEAIDKTLITTLMTALGDSPKQIKAAMAKLEKELGLADGTPAGGGSGGKKVTAPHKIYHPKPEQGGPWRQPGPIVNGTPRVITPASVQASGGGGATAVTIPVTVVISGRKVARVVQHATLQRATSNTSSGLTLPGRIS